MRQRLFLLALTAILVAFFLVWLPHPAAGLSYIGLEMGEQAKFLPQVRSGEIVPGRTLFYLPPVTLALLLLLLTTFWDGVRWQTWAARAVAVATSLLAFPALEALGDPDLAEWLWRVLLIALVCMTAALTPWLAVRPARLRWGAAALVALAGAILPTWAYLAVRPLYAALLRQEIGIGPGVWLNAGAHLLALTVVLELLRGAAVKQAPGKEKETARRGVSDSSFS
jgi:hypothetical protein